MNKLFDMVLLFQVMIKVTLLKNDLIFFLSFGMSVPVTFGTQGL